MEPDLYAITPEERTLIRELARGTAEIAALPIMAQRRKLWTDHNALRPCRPLILVFPEGAERELVPHDTLRCAGKLAASIERNLRVAIYKHDHFDTDMVIPNDWAVPKTIINTGWGLTPKWHLSDAKEGARGFDPVILEYADLKKLRYPEISIDEKDSARHLAFMQELIGDILKVRQVGIRHIYFQPMQVYTSLRGLEQVMVDMLDAPEMLHEAMAFLEEGYHRRTQQYVDLNLLTLNNDNGYQSTGGVGWSDQLPAAGFNPSRVRPCDVWASAESQEMAQVSPPMHAEFAMQYEARLLAPFGLNGYGCCEDLTRKLDTVMAMPNMRRISISPWADVEACARQLGNRFIFSWKPHPAHLAQTFDAAAIRNYIRHALEATRGCVMEMILKDTHTCNNQPQRFTEWTRIAREEVNRFVG
ncbi:MAG: hypothetical protein WC869_09510 [Phycisphaerae bacterium]|jgi:hypothetical protein